MILAFFNKWNPQNLNDLKRAKSLLESENHFILKRLESVYGVKNIMDKYFEM